MLDYLPHHGLVAELGTYRGDFARKILSQATPLHLHLVDLDYSWFDATGLNDGRVMRHTGFAHQVIASFPDGYFDWIYIDADHSYEAVKRDALASSAKLKPGGLLVFNDFTHIDMELGRYGVHRAVVDLAIDNGWPLTFFALDAEGRHDVALQIRLKC